jgi:Bifunctional DNA primase/polymerase, N-terminal
MSATKPNSEEQRGSDRRIPLLLAAAGYARRGMAVFPCLVGYKQPLWRNWETRATRDPAEITRVWSRAPFNVGVACGPSGIVVVDLDVPKGGMLAPADRQPAGVASGVEVLVELALRAGEQFPRTMTVATPRGGRHLVFRAPRTTVIRNSAGSAGWCIDVRAAGGYVIGVGSVVQGVAYRLVNDAPVAELPGWLHAAITQRRSGISEAQGRGSGRRGDGPRSDEQRRRYAVMVLDRECRTLAAMPPDSGRNQRLNTAAFRLGLSVVTGAIDEQDVVAALTTAALRSGLGTTETARTIASGLTGAARKAITQ